jgi:hypothetical protein
MTLLPSSSLRNIFLQDQSCLAVCLFLFNHVGCVPLFQSLPQTPQSGKSFSALLNGGAPGEHSSGVESVPQSASHPDHVSFMAH